MPFDGKPSEHGGGGGGSPNPHPGLVRLVGSMMIGSMLSARGYDHGYDWAVDLKTGLLLVEHDDSGTATIPMADLQPCIAAAQALLEQLTGLKITPGFYFNDPTPPN